jgi:hypothetical protein
MAKRTASKKSTSGEGSSSTGGHPQGRGGDLAGIGQRARDFAGDLQKILGAAQAKASAWLDERRAVVQQLQTIRETAGALLRQLGLQAAESASVPQRRRRRGPGRPPKATGVAASTGRRRRRRFSAETRKKMALAQQRRWAAVRAAKAGKA